LKLCTAQLEVFSYVAGRLQFKGGGVLQLNPLLQNATLATTMKALWNIMGYMGESMIENG